MKKRLAAMFISFTAALTVVACGRGGDDGWDWEEEYILEDGEETEMPKEEKEEAEAEELLPEEAKAASSETAYPALKESDLEAYSKIREKLDEYMTQKDLKSLFSAYRNYAEAYPALSDRLEEKKEQYVKQIGKMFDDWIVEADELMSAGNVEGAREKMDDIAMIIGLKDCFAELEIYQDIIYDRLSYYADYKMLTEPTDLMGSEFDRGDGCYYRDKDWGKYNKYENRYGGSYDEYYECMVEQANRQNHRPYVIFNADGNYDIFSVSFTCHKGMTEDKVFHVEIYGDDTQLYESDLFSSYDEPMTIDVNIEGYKLIKFTAVREDHNLSYATAQPSVAIYQVSFSRAEIPEFEYYIPQESKTEEQNG